MKLSRNRNGGFTLPEVLLTTAILIVLLALSSVEVAKYRNELKLTELDNMAREIYMAAQNRAVLLKNSLRLDGLLKDATKLEGADATEAGGKDCVYIKSDSAAASELLPLGSVDPALRNGKFYIVYEPVSGSVTDVFYAESGELPGIKEAFDLASNRAERLKHSPMLGYYGGGMRAEIGTIPLPTPGVEVLIENGNELVLTVIYSLPDGLPDEVTRTPSVTLDYGSIRVDLLSGEGEKRLVKKYDLNGKTATYQWTLDSMDYYTDTGKVAGLHFRGLFAEDNTPSELGGKFTVTASLKLSKDGYIESSYSAKDSDNSLFDTSTDEGDNEGTARIANLRHLQNLDNFTSGAAGKVAAIQLADIDASTVRNNEGAVKGKEGTYEFVPIENWDLKSYKADSPKSLGTDPYSISNLTVTTRSQSGKSHSGLFSAVNYNFDFKDIRLIRPNVTGGGNAGTLAGSAPSAQFDNCWVSDAVVKGGNYTGGLAGYWWDTEASTGTSYGPIIIKNCKITNLTLEGVNSSGGLVGYGTKAEVTDCTVEGSTITVTGYAFAGGLFGFEDGDINLEGCKVLRSTITGSFCTAAGGLVGNVGNETYKTHASFIDCAAEKITVNAEVHAGGMVGVLATTEDNNKDKFDGCSVIDATVTATRWDSNTGGLIGQGERIHLENCKAFKICANSNYHSGGLVGYSVNSEFINCEAANASVSGTAWNSEVGGLIGGAQNIILDKCRVYWYPEDLSGLDYQVNGVTAGGLVGLVRGGGTITNSFAATLVKGTMYVGGLVGSLPAEVKQCEFTITNSYADCYLYTSAIGGQSWSSASGLVGMREPNSEVVLEDGTSEQRLRAKLTLKDVYAAGFITAEIGSASGLSGGWDSDDITVTNAYAAVHYNMTGVNQIIYALAGNIFPTSPTDNPNNLYFLESAPANEWLATKYSDMRYLNMGSAFESKNGYNTYPYNLSGKNRTGAYPFPGLKGLVHYGDWYTP